ncbi:MAG TPA: EF-P lysine aminoacylase EpmA, partial [Planctomycetota bacterium]|nr:EF-P lysine aminoacylase EpmA [Planctomycetota bacterium]
VDAHIDPMPVRYSGDGSRSHPGRARRLFLHTSPEAFMKRLLVAGSGSIYQIARVFRDGEAGRWHNPEFTMLEWYRPGFGLDAMMDEVGELVSRLLERNGWEKRTYRELFERKLGFDPHSVPALELPKIAKRKGIPYPESLEELDRNGWLDLFLSLSIGPELGWERPVFVHGFPVSQAALAQIGGDEHPVAERFELFVDGTELANGYHELLDPREHRLRFEEANLRRTGRGKEALPIDADFLASLEEGLPACSGVALGFDRLVMIALGAESIADVISFAFDPRSAPADEEDARDA